MDVRHRRVRYRDAPHDGAECSPRALDGTFDAEGMTARSHFYMSSNRFLSRRSITMIVNARWPISSTAAGSFIYYHAVSVAGLSAGARSTMTWSAADRLLDFRSEHGPASDSAACRPWSASASSSPRAIYGFTGDRRPTSRGRSYGSRPDFSGSAYATHSGTVASNAAATELFPTH